MILQPKSSNLPETTDPNPKEAIVSAGLNMIPGSENAAVTAGPTNKQPFGAEGGDKKKDDPAQVAASTTTPRQQKKTTTTPMKEDKPVLGQ